MSYVSTLYVGLFYAATVILLVGVALRIKKYAQQDNCRGVKQSDVKSRHIRHASLSFEKYEIWIVGEFTPPRLQVYVN